MQFLNKIDMKMDEYINNFTNQLRDAVKIGNSNRLISRSAEIRNVLICGLGGSGIGGAIIADIIAKRSDVPIISNKDYSVPGFVNSHTLVIANSYSGNTEETICALNKCRKKGAEIAIITSGGLLKQLATENNYNMIIIPKGGPPRAMFGYAFSQLFYVLNHYGIIDDFFKSDFKKSIALLDSVKSEIQKKAKKLAKKLYGKIPVIYVAEGFEGVAMRFRQQINENSKMLCWHHVVPEMNHNELLGWRGNREGLAVIYFRNNLDYKRNKIRIKINKEIIEKCNEDVSEIWSKGDSLIENTLYHINFGDWVSWYLSEMNGVDAIEIDVINFLKTELSKLK